MVCSVSDCERDAVAKGLCMYHYKRQRAGKPLVDTGPRRGDPSGLGRYGIVDRDEHQCLCHECGRWFASVSGHIYGAHGLRARDYKRKHGIPAGEALICNQLRREISEQSRERVGGIGWRKLEAARDPVAAAAAREGRDVFYALRSDPEAAERARMNGRRILAIEYPCVVCGTLIAGGRLTCSEECLTVWRADRARRQQNNGLRELTDEEAERLYEAGLLIRQLQTDGVRSADIAAALGVLAGWLSSAAPLDEDTGHDHRTRK